ncbi:MAG: hypothetical protein RBS55_05940 [Bacteroidales bacterium]|jgi:tetratricopeptide (TPR) repeat protein|nr:hypothetical protein [Bacteroidales bacterium]
MKRLFFVITFSLIFAGIPSVNSFGQEDQGAGKYGSDSLTCITNISLYREFFKQWKASDYKSETIHDLIPPWRWVFLNCPRGTQNTYIDGAKIVSYLVETTSDPDLKDKYIDTLMMLYDQRIQYFGKEGFVLGRKGVDLFTYRPKDVEKIYEYLKRSVELEGENTAGPVLIYYMNSAVNLAKSGKSDSTVIFDAYDVSSEIIDKNLKTNEGNEEEKKNWITIQSNVELILEPFATCPDLVTIYRKKFNQTPDDVELLKKISNLLEQKKCHTDPFYFETTVKLYELEPSPESAYMIGKMLLNEGKYAEAIDYLKQAEKLNDTATVQKSFMYIAKAYQALNNYPSSRAFALKAAALDPTDGDPYMLIGDLYAASAKDCGGNDLTNHVAYWVAVDKYQRAKQVEPALAPEADKLIYTYSAYFPATSTIFFYTLKEGDIYRVECWINEDTRIRASKQ